MVSELLQQGVGTVVISFISFWCFKDLKYGLVDWSINFTSEPVLEIRAILAVFCMYGSHCVSLGLPIPADVVASDCFSLPGVPEGGRPPHGHSHHLVLRHQLESGQAPERKDTRRAQWGLGWRHWGRGSFRECQALATLMPHCCWSLAWLGFQICLTCPEEGEMDEGSDPLHGSAQRQLCLPAHPLLSPFSESTPSLRHISVWGNQLLSAAILFPKRLVGDSQSLLSANGMTIPPSRLIMWSR